MQFGKPDTGNFRGYEVDILKELSRRAGFRLNFRRALWGAIISELVTGEIDLVCRAATITKEREHKVDFCSPHLDVTLAVVKRSGVAANTPLDTLRIDVRRGTTAETCANTISAFSSGDSSIAEGFRCSQDCLIELIPKALA